MIPEYLFNFIYLCAVRVKDDNKRTQIHQATLKLVSEVGLSGISMAAIAKEAGRSWWSQGFTYIRVAGQPYWLWIPLRSVRQLLDAR